MEVKSLMGEATLPHGDILIGVRGYIMDVSFHSYYVDGEGRLYRCIENNIS
jgi:hypothetical protein